MVVAGSAVVVAGSAVVAAVLVAGVVVATPTVLASPVGIDVVVPSVVGVIDVVVGMLKVFFTPCNLFLLEIAHNTYPKTSKRAETMIIAITVTKENKGGHTKTIDLCVVWIW